MWNLLIKVPLSYYLAICFMAFSLWVRAGVARAQPLENPLTADRAVQMALEQNLELKVQERDLGKAQGELLKAKVFTNPELELSAETDSVFSNEGEAIYSIGLGQTFFVGNKRRYRIGIAELNVSKTQSNIENARRLLIARVQEAFFTLVFLQEEVRLADELIQINDRLMQLSEGRFREGFAPELDVGLSRIQLKEAQRNRALLEKDLSVTRANLNLLMGRPAQASLSAQGELREQEMHLDMSQLKRTAINHRADLKGQEVAIDVAGTEIDLARAERIPDITLSLDYTQERSVFSELNFSDREQLAGLKLSVPIPLFNRNQGEILQARVRQGSASLELDLLRAVIEKEVTNAATRVQVAHKTFKLYREGILPLAEKHFRLTEGAYEQGQAGILDVIEAQRRFSEARLGYLEALLEYNLALVEMERSVGVGLVGTDADEPHAFEGRQK